MLETEPEEEKRFLEREKREILKLKMVFFVCLIQQRAHHRKQFFK